MEILSNPSISSIEVLENFSRHPSRKHSEERSIYLQNQLPNEVQSLYKTGDAANGIKSSSNSDIEELMNEPHDDMEHHEVNDVADTHTNETIKNTKKTVLTGMNLTESSSSGSVTDSVCTAYEHQAVDTKNSVEVSSTSTISEAGENDELTSNKADESTSLSTMFGGEYLYIVYCGRCHVQIETSAFHSQVYSIRQIC